MAAWPGLAALDGAARADACVVGLGGSGLAAVEELTLRGLSVVGVDAGRVAAGAAGRNGGLLLGGGALALHEAQRHWGKDVAVSLYRATLAELDRLAQLLGPEIVHRVGSIRLAGLPGDPRDEAEAADRARELADCAAQRVKLEAAGIAVEEYDGVLGQGLYLPDDAAVNPARHVLGLAERHGAAARLYERSTVHAISPGRVETAAGSISAGVVIVAVDGRLDQLLPQLAPLVRTARLQMLATAPGLPWRLPWPVYGRWGYDYAQQDPAGRIFAGGGRDLFAHDEWTASSEPTDPVQGWIESVAERLAGAPVTVTHRWAASAGFTPDGRALCLPVDDGVVACGGYSGTGNLVGPVAARAAVALAVDGTQPPPYFTSRLP